MIASAIPAPRLRVSPIARRLAASRGIVLDRVRGSGPGGRIIRFDIENAAARPQPEASRPVAAPAVQPGTALRQSIDVSVEALLALQAMLSESRTGPVSLDALLLKAVDLACDGDGVRLEGADLRMIGPAALSRILPAGPAWRLASPELHVTCIPDGGPEDAAPALHIPGMAQLVFAAPAERVLPRGGVPAVVTAMRCNLLADDAALDGAAFLTRLRQLIEQPLGIVA